MHPTTPGSHHLITASAAQPPSMLYAAAGWLLTTLAALCTSQAPLEWGHSACCCSTSCNPSHHPRVTRLFTQHPLHNHQAYCTQCDGQDGCSQLMQVCTVPKLRWNGATKHVVIQHPAMHPTAAGIHHLHTQHPLHNHQACISYSPVAGIYSHSIHCTTAKHAARSANGQAGCSQP